MSSWMQIILFCLATLSSVMSELKAPILLSLVIWYCWRNFERIYASDILLILITIGVM